MVEWAVGVGMIVVIVGTIIRFALSRGTNSQV